MVQYVVLHRYQTSTFILFLCSEFKMFPDDSSFKGYLSNWAHFSVGEENANVF
jgi:hypothetical protein